MKQIDRVIKCYKISTLFHAHSNKTTGKIFPLQELQTIPNKSSYKVLIINFKLLINYKLLRIGKIMESRHNCDTIARRPCINISTTTAGSVTLFFDQPFSFSFSPFVFFCHFQSSIKATVVFQKYIIIRLPHKLQAVKKTCAIFWLASWTIFRLEECGRWLTLRKFMINKRQKGKITLNHRFEA